MRLTRAVELPLAGRQRRGLLASLDPTDRNSVAQTYVSHVLSQPASGYTGDPATCTPGTTSTAYIEVGGLFQTGVGFFAGRKKKDCACTPPARRALTHEQTLGQIQVTVCLSVSFCSCPTDVSCLHSARTARPGALELVPRTDRHGCRQPQRQPRHQVPAGRHHVCLQGVTFFLLLSS